MPTPSNTQTVAWVVVVAVVAALVLGILVPAGINAITDSQQKEIRQTQGTEYDVRQGYLQTELSAIDALSNNVTVELSHRNESQQTLEFSNESQTKSATFDGDTVSVTLIETHSDTEATIRYEFETTFGWTETETAAFSSIVYFIILVPIMAVGALLIEVFP